MSKLFRRGLDDIGVGTVCVCHDGQGNVLLQKRASSRKIEPGKWDVVGGTLERGLTLVENVKKEIREEYGAKVKKVNFLGYREVIDVHAWRDQHWLAMDFVAEIARGSEKIGEPDKVSEIGWFPKDNLPKPLHFTMKDYIKKNWNKF
ncbi:MAG: NUDIX domain-containing protein [Candidatus Vogelbacteria bacterium]|nr:NUDIX domain-containing protein [Candidatus Vogelbacteria bacterium]